MMLFVGFLFFATVVRFVVVGGVVVWTEFLEIRGRILAVERRMAQLDGRILGLVAASVVVCVGVFYHAVEFFA